jgi:hypothetical protein
MQCESCDNKATTTLSIKTDSNAQIKNCCDNCSMKINLILNKKLIEEIRSKTTDSGLRHESNNILTILNHYILTNETRQEKIERITNRIKAIKEAAKCKS